MIKRSLASALVAASILAGAPSLPVQAQTAPQLSLNAVQAAPAEQPNTWRLTLEFGRADRSPNATARSVDAPALAAHDIMITAADGIAAPFIVSEVGTPSGNEITVLIEYFGATAFAAGSRFTLSVLEDQVVDAARASASFDFLPPAITSNGG